MRSINQSVKNKRKYTLNSLESYNLAIKLRKEKGWEGKRIKDYLAELGINTPIGSIEGWIYYDKEPFLTKIIKHIPEDSKDLIPKKAYILGILCGDGYISTGYRIGLGVCDREFADFFKYCLDFVYKVESSITLRTRMFTNISIKPKPQYVISLVSKLVVKDLQKYITSFKSKEWVVPFQIKKSSKEIQANFIRGFADSEAHVRFRKGQSEINICSGNILGLKMIKDMLTNNFEINTHMGENSSGVPVIVVTKYESLKIFYNEIGFVIKRKQNALKQALDSYKRKGLRRYSREFKLKAINLLKSGLKHKEVAKLLGTSPANVYDWEKAIKNL